MCRLFFAAYLETWHVLSLRSVNCFTVSADFETVIHGHHIMLTNSIEDHSMEKC